MEYTGAVETAYHSYIREEPRTDSGIVTEVASGIRMMAAPAVEGGEYYEGTAGNEWYPVEYNMGDGQLLHGYIASGLCSVIEHPV
jgi:hypothetical protein